MLFTRRTVFKILACLMIGLCGANSYLAQQAAADRTVTLTVTVTDQDLRFVGGIEKNQFSLLEKKSPIEIESFSNDDRPLSVAILLDLSGSQAGKIIHSANWITHFIGSGNSSNEYLILGFDSTSHLLCDWGCGTKDLVAALGASIQAAPKGGTALYDTCDLALRKMERSSNVRRIVVILSDGLDNLSKVTFTQLRRSLKQSDVMVYSVVMINRIDLGSHLGHEGQGVLDELAAVTGGKAFFARSKDEMMDNADHIALELKHQYRLTFKVAGPKDHELHKIKVKVTSPVVQLAGKTIHLRWRYKEEIYNP